MIVPVVRVNQSLLPTYQGQTVAVIGKVLTTSAQSTQLEASDGGIVTVIPAPGSDHSSPYVEIIGKVTGENQVQEFTCTPIGETFDLKNYDQLVKLSTTTYQHLF